jgi:hydroxyacylglutathione hydrolase
MEIKQFEDKNLAHFSYAILSKGEVALIDPARDPKPYYEYAKEHNAIITAVIETHPHADFVSSHLEIAKHTGATIYVSKLLGADYEHQSFDDGDAIILGTTVLKSINTPGHSPDSISIIALTETGEPKAVFTGDTLFIGDCGRPDLRENAGNITATRESLAKQMYHSLRDKLLLLPDNVIVFPAHGAGSLCGKGLSDQLRSTMGAEKISNWSLQNATEEEFVKELLLDQPFIPKYFPFDVEINKKGAANFKESISSIETAKWDNDTLANHIIIDTRKQTTFRNGHLPNAFNLMDDTKFETWLGSIVSPNEKFYLLAENEITLNQLIERIAKIGYETQIIKAFYGEKIGENKEEEINVEAFRKSTHEYTIIDIRNQSEVKQKAIFKNSINIPLFELREKANTIKTNKPIVVHCAGGYRSAAGASIIKSELNGNSVVLDLSEAIKTF